VKTVLSQKPVEVAQYGCYHVGTQYDLSIWWNMKDCDLYNCMQQVPKKVTIEDQGGDRKKVIKFSK
jgi:hypothetical protein